MEKRTEQRDYRSNIFIKKNREHWTTIARIIQTMNWWLHIDFKFNHSGGIMIRSERLAGEVAVWCRVSHASLLSTQSCLSGNCEADQQESYVYIHSLRITRT